MMTIDAKFVQGFTEECERQGLSLTETEELYKQAHEDELSEDPDYQSGFFKVLASYE
jgi:hypothetical protein